MVLKGYLKGRPLQGTGTLDVSLNMEELL